MKKHISISLGLLLLSTTTIAQNNVFPSSGNVGIGITNPSTKLEVRGTLRTSYTNDRYVNLYGSGDGNAYLNYQGGGTTSRLGFMIDGSSKMSIMDNGNIGIATTNPSTKLEVRGSFRTSYNNDRYLNFLNSGDGNAYINYQGGGTTSRLGIMIDGSSKMSILDNGNVGIGTTVTGSHKLAVNGSIGAREIKVEVGSWSDFVFYNDYQLPSLKEVEAHIKEKGHLINIPSAKDVAKNGIQLGEMNKLLLEKIEELTLYTLQQEKQLKDLSQLKKENELLSKRMARLETSLLQLSETNK